MDADHTTSRREQGFALVELLAVCATSIVVLTAVSLFVASSIVHNASTSGRVDALDRASFGLERLQTDLRQALELSPTVATTTQASSVDVRRYVTTPTGAAEHWFRLSCTAGGSIPGTHACTRKDLTTNAAPITLLDGITGSTSIFTLRPAPAGQAMGTIDLDVTTAVQGRASAVALSSSVTPRACLDGYPSGQGTCPG
jgi:hypothetical protein